MTCDDDEANVNGTSALPALACDDVTNVLVDAEDGANTVNLGGLTQLAFPMLARTSIDVADSDADSVTGSEARDVVRADFLDDVSTGLGDDWVEGAGSVSGGEGNDTLREISGSVQGGSGDDLIVGAPAGSHRRWQRLRLGRDRLLGLHQSNNRQPGDHRRGHQRRDRDRRASRRTT